MERIHSLRFLMDVDAIGCMAEALITVSFFSQTIKALRMDDTCSISLSMYGQFT